MLVFETLAPILLLIGLGAALAHLRFLGRSFIADLNKLVFWVALPAMIVVSLAEIEQPTPRMGVLLGIMMAMTLLVTLLAWVAARILRLPGPSAGTLMQAAFRGNLGYTGIPVISYALLTAPPEVRRAELATALLVMAAATVLYNVLAVVVLQAAQQKLTRESFRLMLGGVATNPMIIACLVGLLFPLLDWRLPTFLRHTLETLGHAAVPVGLMCVGGSLVTLSFHGRRAAIISGACLKVFACPLIAGGLCALARLTPEESRTVLIFAACPTTVASFVMAGKLSGDEPLASGAIALSTLLSALSLAGVLWLT